MKNNEIKKIIEENKMNKSMFNNDIYLNENLFVTDQFFYGLFNAINLKEEINGMKLEYVTFIDIPFNILGNLNVTKSKVNNQLVANFTSKEPENKLEISGGLSSNPYDEYYNENYNNENVMRGYLKSKNQLNTKSSFNIQVESDGFLYQYDHLRDNGSSKNPYFVLEDMKLSKQAIVAKYENKLSDKSKITLDGVHLNSVQINDDTDLRDYSAFDDNAIDIWQYNDKEEISLRNYNIEFCKEFSGFDLKAKYSFLDETYFGGQKTRKFTAWQKSDDALRRSTTYANLPIVNDLDNDNMIRGRGSVNTLGGNTFNNDDNHNTKNKIDLSLEKKLSNNKSLTKLKGNLILENHDYTNKRNTYKLENTLRNLEDNNDHPVGGGVGTDVEGKSIDLSVAGKLLNFNRNNIASSDEIIQGPVIKKEAINDQKLIGSTVTENDVNAFVLEVEAEGKISDMLTYEAGLKYYNVNAEEACKELYTADNGVLPNLKLNYVLKQVVDETSGDAINKANVNLSFNQEVNGIDAYENADKFNKINLGSDYKFDLFNAEHQIEANVYSIWETSSEPTPYNNCNRVQDLIDNAFQDSLGNETGMYITTEYLRPDEYNKKGFDIKANLNDIKLGPIKTSIVNTMVYYDSRYTSTEYTYLVLDEDGDGKLDTLETIETDTSAPKSYWFRNATEINITPNNGKTNAKATLIQNNKSGEFLGQKFIVNLHADHMIRDDLQVYLDVNQLRTESQKQAELNDNFGSKSSTQPRIKGGIKWHMN